MFSFRKEEVNEISNATRAILVKNKMSQASPASLVKNQILLRKTDRRMPCFMQDNAYFQSLIFLKLLPDT